jgi:hypothetical protein
MGRIVGRGDDLGVFTCPDTLQLWSDRRSQDHLAQTGGNDVMLDMDLVFGESRLSLDVLAHYFEEVGQSGVEVDLGTEPPEEIVAQTWHSALSDVGENVIQVEVVALDELGSVGSIELGETVDFLPELGLIDPEVTE